MAETSLGNLHEVVAESVGDALWVRAKITSRWPAPYPERKLIGAGSEVWILRVVKEEPAALIVDEWGHLQWVTLDSVEVSDVRRYA